MNPNHAYDLSIFTLETSYHVDSHRLSQFIADAYGVEKFEIIELDNDTTYEYHVTGKVESWDEEAIKEGLVDAMTEEYHVSSFLNDLCAQHIIHAGKYYLRSCW